MNAIKSTIIGGSSESVAPSRHLFHVEARIVIVSIKSIPNRTGDFTNFRWRYSIENGTHFLNVFVHTFQDFDQFSQAPCGFGISFGKNYDRNT